MCEGSTDHAVRTLARPQRGAPAARRHRLALSADLVRVGIFLLAAVLLAAGDGSSALKALLVLLPAGLARLVRPHPGFDLLFTVALGGEAIGTAVGAYDSIAWGDALSHFVLPLLSGPILYVALVRLGAVPQPDAAPTDRFLVGAAVITAIAVMCLGALWELVEWAADSTVGTHYSQGYEDTLVDLSVDAIAAVGAGALVAIWLRAKGGRSASSLAMIPLEGAERTDRRLQQEGDR